MNSTQPYETPLEHLSYSALTTLLRNPAAFKKKYQEKIYDQKVSPSALVGQACHKFVEVLLKDGLDLVDAALEEGYKHIRGTSDVAIEYGKTGTREAIMQSYANGTRMYLEECADRWIDRTVLSVEGKYTEVIHDDLGRELGLPAKCFVDALWQSTKVETFNGKEYPAGTLFVEDHKFVRSYEDADDLSPARLIQAMFNWHIIRETKLKKAPAAVIFNEVKLTQNRNGEPQSQYYVIDMNDQAQYFSVFYRLYNDVLKKVVSHEDVYLPNFFDPFDGKQTWVEYCQGLISVESPEIVAPKVRELRYQEKEYVESAQDRKGNENLTPEEKIRRKFQEFGIPVDMQETHTNGNVCMYTCKPSRGVRMSAIEKHDKDIALALKARSVRIQAPIRGTGTVGIEVPAEKRVAIQYDTSRSYDLLEVPIGTDVFGVLHTTRVQDMPHLLVAGTTGSGKSTWINGLIRTLAASDPKDVQLLLIDMKRVELAQHNDLPHLLTKVIYETHKAIAAISWLNEEMDRRYEMLERKNVRNIAEVNGVPYLLAIVDEYAHLIHSAGPGLEKTIVRLAQMARAVGIHLVLATQRPSVDVVTGLIRSNFPSRICFSVPTRIESTIVLDSKGAEELTGKGDMLYMGSDGKPLQRLQAFSL